MWCHLVAKFVTKASIATWWPKLEPMLMHYMLAKFVTNASGILFSWVNARGPLCLWQCFNGASLMRKLSETKLLKCQSLTWTLDMELKHLVKSEIFTVQVFGRAASGWGGRRNS